MRKHTICGFADRVVKVYDFECLVILEAIFKLYHDVAVDFIVGNRVPTKHIKLAQVTRRDRFYHIQFYRVHVILTGIEMTNVIHWINRNDKRYPLDQSKSYQFVIHIIFSEILLHEIVF
jgi:hypothetical protein